MPSPSQAQGTLVGEDDDSDLLKVGNKRCVNSQTEEISQNLVSHQDILEIDPPIIFSSC